MVVNVNLPFENMPSRIVDDRRFVVRKSHLGATLRTLRFLPALDSHYHAPAQQCSLSSQGFFPGGEGGVFQGTRYFLEIMASPQIVFDAVYDVELTFLPDSDGDNMDDDFENEHGLDPMVDDGDQDKDKDGFTNVEEYEAGTDPNDPNSSLPNLRCNRARQ